MTGDVNIRHTYPYSAGGKSSDLIQMAQRGQQQKKKIRIRPQIIPPALYASVCLRDQNGVDCGRRLNSARMSNACDGPRQHALCTTERCKLNGKRATRRLVRAEPAVRRRFAQSCAVRAKRVSKF